MTADAVPAPMVQVPAETVDKLREALRFQFSPPKRSQVDAVFTAASAVVDVAERCEAKFARLQMERANLGAEYEASERRANRAENERDRLRRLLDAATPAASVPAADILALADELTHEIDEGRWQPMVHNTLIRIRSELRALVDAADSPRVDEGQTEPLCKCGHIQNLHKQGVGVCSGGPSTGFTRFCTCGLFRLSDRTPAAPSPSTREATYEEAQQFKCAECGHPETAHSFHLNKCLMTEDCPCKAFTPAAPSPSTREPVPTQLTDAEKRLLTEGDGGACEPPCDICLDLFNAVESILAARLSASTAREDT